MHMCVCMANTYNNIVSLISHYFWVDSLKTELEKMEEDAMITELVELVEKRDKLLWTLHLEKTL